MTLTSSPCSLLYLPTWDCSTRASTSGGGTIDTTFFRRPHYRLYLLFPVDPLCLQVLRRSHTLINWKFACWASLCGAQFGRNRWLAEDTLARINAQIEERAEHAQAAGHQKRRLPVDELNHITYSDGR